MPKGDFRSVYLPYCMQKMADGRFIMLNRDYKPVGFSTKEHIEYEEYPIAVRFKRLTETTIRSLSWSNDVEDQEGRIWLYSDSCVPTASAKNMREYMARLEILARLKLNVDF